MHSLALFPCLFAPLSVSCDVFFTLPTTTIERALFKHLFQLKSSSAPFLHDHYLLSFSPQANFAWMLTFPVVWAKYGVDFWPAIIQTPIAEGCKVILFQRELIYVCSLYSCSCLDFFCLSVCLSFCYLFLAGCLFILSISVCRSFLSVLPCLPIRLWSF